MGRSGRHVGKYPVATRDGATSNPLRVRQGKDKYHPPLSLQDEARNTELHHFWNPDLKLRHARVAFVSVGHDQQNSTDLSEELNGTQSELPKRTLVGDQLLRGQFMAGLSLNDSHVPPISSTSTGKSEAHSVLLHPDEVEHVEDLSVQTENEVFYTDLNGAVEPTHTGLPPPAVRRSSSLSLSDSSEEIIVFSGRKRPVSKTNKGFASIPTSLHRQNSQPMISKQHSNTFQSIQRIVIDDPVFDVLSARLLSPGIEDQSNAGADRNIKQVSFSDRSKKKKSRRKPGLTKTSQDDILDDYIANVKNSEDNEDLAGGTLLTTHNISATEGQALLNEINAPSIEYDENFLPGHIQGWDSTDLHDLDNLSTSSDDRLVVTNLLSKRWRPSGVQYLVVGEMQSVDDARWIPIESLSKPSALEQIRIYETKRLGAKEQSLSSDGSDDDYVNKRNVAIDLQDELDDIEDEQDLLNRKIAQMTDEKLARLLSKQEELGLGSSDIMLFDGNEYEDEDRSTTSIENMRHHLFRSKYNKTEEYQKKLPPKFALENAMDYDPYDSFDVTDRNRPSLRKLSKGRRSMLALEPSDPDMRNSLQAAWENDRAKKKAQKQERERLRQLGLIGKKNRNATKAQGLNDSSITKLKEIITDFLKSPAESLSLEPMDHTDRKSVHQIANLLKLKSKSIGSGQFRFPVLQKTARTVVYNSVSMDTIVSQISSGGITRRKEKFTKKSSNIVRGARGGGSSAAVSYRDGEIVGASAPELGQENKGRAMLEKMGWSTGTALGASNNKGIMQPLAHVVKTTKAGLG